MLSRLQPICSSLVLLIAFLALCRPCEAQPRIDPEAQVWVDRWNEQLDAVKSVYGRFLFEEKREYDEPAKPPDPNQRLKVYREPSYSLAECQWVWDGFRERWDREQIEPKEPLPGEFRQREHRFFNGEVLIDQAGKNVNLRSSSFVRGRSPAKFLFFVLGRHYKKALEEAASVRFVGREVKQGVPVVALELEYEASGIRRVRLYFEENEPFWLRGHEEFGGRKVHRSKWIKSYDETARRGGLLFPREAIEVTPFNRAQYRLITVSLHVNEPIPEESWNAEVAPGSVVKDWMTGNRWTVGPNGIDDTNQLVQQPIDMANLQGEASNSQGSAVTPARRDPVAAARSAGTILNSKLILAFSIGGLLVGFGLWSLFRRRDKAASSPP